MHTSSGSPSGHDGASHDLVPDVADQRGRVVRLTDRGWDARRVARAAQAETDAAWEGHLGTRRTRALRAALEVLRGAVDPWA